MRLLVARQRGEILEEGFAADVTLTLQLPANNYEAFQNDLRELSAGKIEAALIETKQAVLPL